MRIDFDTIKHRLLLEIHFRCPRCGDPEWLVLEKIDEGKPFSDENAKLVCITCKDQDEELRIVNLIPVFINAAVTGVWVDF